MLQNLQEINKQLQDAASEYKANVTAPRKMLLHVHATKIENVTNFLHAHQYPPAPTVTSNNIDPYLDAEYAPKLYRFQQAINKLTTKSNSPPAPTVGGPAPQHLSQIYV